jgi:hypothetical protein
MGQQLTYKVYVIQIGNQVDKLFVNYAIEDINTKYNLFLYRHPAIPTSILRPDLYEHLPIYENNNQAMAACKKLITELEKKGFDVIAGTPLYADKYSVYVLKLDNNDKFVYVGQSLYTPDIRLKQHRYLYHCAQKMKNIKTMELFPAIYEQLPKFDTEQESKLVEVNLAKSLAQNGYRVIGGH